MSTWRDALLTPPAFWSPDRISGESAWVTHIPFAFALASAMRPRVFVELGTHAGDSYLAITQAVDRIGFSCACFAVDTWEGDPHAGLYGEDVFQSLALYHDRKYGGFSTLMRMTFEEAASHFPDSSVDLLHIDGFHTYEAVRGDFETWLPKMSSSGVVLFHDVNVRQQDFGVWRYWEEVRETGPSFAFVHGHGLGVLAVGDTVPDAVAALVEGGQDVGAVAEIQSAFAKLGWQIQNEYQLSACRSASDKLAARLGEAEARLAESARSLDECQSEARASEARVAEAHRQLALLLQSRSWKLGSAIVRSGRRVIPRSPG